MNKNYLNKHRQYTSQMKNFLRFQRARDINERKAIQTEPNKIKPSIMNIFTHLLQAKPEFGKRYYGLLMFLLAVFSLSGQSYELSMIRMDGDQHVGKSSIAANKIKPGLTEVKYSFARTTTPNPYAGSYSYQIIQTETEIILDMMSVLSDLDAYIDPGINVKYSGDQVKFPKTLPVGAKLPDLQGAFHLTKTDTPIDIKYKVVLTDRVIQDKKTFNVEGQTFEAFQVSYQLSQKNFVKGEILSESEQKLTDWIVPEIGVLERVRKGKVDYGQMETTLNQQIIISRK